MIDDQKVVESLNVTFDDTKSSSIQKEDDDETMNVEDLFDNEREPEVVPLDNDNGDDSQDNHNGDSNSDGNGGDSQDVSGPTNVISETTSGTNSQSFDSTN